MAYLLAFLKGSLDHSETILDQWQDQESEGSGKALRFCRGDSAPSCNTSTIAETIQTTSAIQFPHASNGIPMVCFQTFNGRLGES
jgi:hypothetical protein